MNLKNSYLEKVCICPNCFPGYGIAEVIQQSIQAGIHRVSLPVGTWSASGLDPEKLMNGPQGGMWKDNLFDLKELLRKNRIEVPMVETAELIGAAESEKRVQNLIDFCVELNVPLLNIACAPPPLSEEEKNAACLILRKGAQYAATVGVRLVLETYNGITRNAQECLRTLEKIGEQNIGINYDTGNVLQFSPELSGAELAEKDLRLLSGHLWSMHLKDCRRNPYQTEILGQGDVNFPAVFWVLDGMNFSGVLGLDLETTAAVNVEDYFTALQKSLRYLKNVLEA